MICQVFNGYYILNTFKTFGAAYISDDHFLTLIGSIGTLLNGFSRIVLAGLLDKISFKKINSIILFI